jgi:hypothetical protein
MAQPVIVASLSLDGTVMIAAEGLHREEWARVAVTLAGTLPRKGEPLPVSADVLLSGRASLVGLLRRLQVGFRADQAVTELLRRAEDDQQALAALVGPNPTPIRPVEPGPVTVVRELRPFQARDLEALWAMHHGANFSVPGAGKTTVTYALNARERNLGRVDKLLVVGLVFVRSMGRGGLRRTGTNPHSRALGNWRREQRCHPDQLPAATHRGTRYRAVDASSFRASCDRRGAPGEKGSTG